MNTTTLYGWLLQHGIEATLHITPLSRMERDADPALGALYDFARAHRVSFVVHLSGVRPRIEITNQLPGAPLIDPRSNARWTAEVRVVLNPEPDREVTDHELRRLADEFRQAARTVLRPIPAPAVAPSEPAASPTAPSARPRRRRAE